MKLFTTTVESTNSCYVRTLLIIAPSKESVKDLVVEWRKNELSNPWKSEYVKYLEDIKELSIKIDETEPKVIPIWFGHNECDHGGFDD